MYRGASALLAILLLASRMASSTPPPDQVMQCPIKFLQHAQVIVLVHVEKVTPPFIDAPPEPPLVGNGAVAASNLFSKNATVRVIKSWKGPWAPGRILHVEAPTAPTLIVGASWYVFQPAQDLIIVGHYKKDQDPIAAQDGWVWSASESQPLMNALDEAVVLCPSCARPPLQSR